jgi:phenylacetate-CoA ligase
MNRSPQQMDSPLVPNLRQEARTPKGQAVLNLLRRFDETQWWAPERLENEQFRFLELLLGYARQTTEYYGKSLDKITSMAASDLQAGGWSEVPILPRADVNEFGKQMRSAGVPEGHGDKFAIYTSGTTGQPIKLIRTRLALWYWSAFTLRDHIWHSRDLKGTFGAIRTSTKGKALYPGGDRFHAWGSSDNVFETGPCVGLNINSSTEEMVEWLGRRDPDYLLTHPTVVASLTRYCRERGIRFNKLKEVMTLSEILPPDLRESVRQVWDVKLSDMYSGREVGYITLQCPDYPHYHVMAEGIFVEVLDDNDRPVGPGETGRVVLTTLHNFAQPLIRYEIGDYAEVGELCPCGRGLPVLTRIHGRKQNVLTLPSGETRWTLLSSGDIRHLMGLAPIRQYQFAQIEKDVIEVRLAVLRQLTDGEEKAIADWTRAKFAYPFNVSFAYAEELARSKAGKFQDFISEVS